MLPGSELTSDEGEAVSLKVRSFSRAEVCPISDKYASLCWHWVAATYIARKAEVSRVGIIANNWLERRARPTSTSLHSQG
jgi:hypothetical protein